MSEYWKSQPRKFCEYCKCWIADNKPSIVAHESGKRHQDNVATKIADVQRKGQKDYEDQKKLEYDLKRMEKNAAHAYERDLERMHQEKVLKIKDEEQRLLKEIEEEDKAAAEEETEMDEKTAALAAKSPWFEAKSPDGYSYYWNVNNNETTWIVPAEGFVSLQEQAEEEDESEAGTSTSKARKKEDDGKVKLKFGAPVKVSANAAAKKPAPKPVKNIAVQLAPKPKEAGSWQPVKEPKATKAVDLQLPKVEKAELQVPTLHRQPGIKFREKTASSGAGSALEAFKKRKLDSERLKYVRKPSTQ